MSAFTGTNSPSTQDWRAAARVMRWTARRLTEIRKEESLWKKLTTSYPTKKLEEFATAFDEIANQWEEIPAKAENAARKGGGVER